MKRQVQHTGVRRWAGAELVALQAEPLTAIDSFFAEYGPCIITGLEINQVNGKNNITAGLVVLEGTNHEGKRAVMVAPFTGAQDVTFPVFLTLAYDVQTRVYGNKGVKPIAYHYRADLSGIEPAAPYLKIAADGGPRFRDVFGLTDKLNKTGNGKDVTVTFAEATERANINSGEKLSALFGKIRKWFAGLATVAFSGKAADLTQDTNNRFVTDTEKTDWNDKYTKSQTDTKDADTLTAAKNYTDMLSGNTYKKSETYNRMEVDNKDSATLETAKSYTDTLSGNVYKKAETYTRFEIDDKDAASLQAAKNYAAQKVAEVVNGSPAALDTLQELAAALGNDPNFATSIMALIGGKADADQVANLQSELNSKEPAFSKNTAFNKNFGTVAGTVCQGSDVRLSDARTPTTHTHPASQITEDSTRQFVSDADKNTWNDKADSNHNHDSLYLKPTDLQNVAFTGSATDITESVNKRFVTDASKTMLQNVPSGAQLWNNSNLKWPMNIAFMVLISGDGRILFNLGQISVYVLRIGTGAYRISHNIGHTNYFIHANCVDCHGYVFYSKKNANSFEVGTAHDGAMNDKNFSITVFYFN